MARRRDHRRRVLDPLTDDDAQAAADALTEGLLALSPGAAIVHRLLSRQEDPR